MERSAFCVLSVLKRVLKMHYKANETSRGLSA